MSLEDVKNNCQDCFTRPVRENKEIVSLINEYWDLAKEYDETRDAKKVRQKADEYLYGDDRNLKRALSLMRLAVKILKACNGVTS
ncbi:MAG: hypothetical protein ACTSO7_00495 [Candidatus Heimdallarchaeota archaeon]